jgi:hypothetical protein
METILMRMGMRMKVFVEVSVRKIDLKTKMRMKVLVEEGLVKRKMLLVELVQSMMKMKKKTSVRMEVIVGGLVKRKMLLVELV